MKNVFKKNNVVDTAINVGIGAVANIAVDYAISAIDTENALEPMYVNGGKFLVGVVGSTMIGEKMVKAALDGVAVVGLSNLVNDLMNSDSTSGGSNGTREGATAGVPRGTIGRVRRYVPGHRNLARSMRQQKTSGTGYFVS